MEIKLTSNEISEKYNHFARWYDLVEGIPDLLGVRGLRQRLIRHVSANVLEVAVGTGKNLRYYPPDCQITAIDRSGAMLNRAVKRAAKLRMGVSFLLTDAETLPFSDKSFDTVVSSLSMCTFPNPVAALQEMGRVCRTQGKVFLLEHGRSDSEWLAGWQDRHADQFAKPLGCHWNREPLKIVKAAGLQTRSAWRTFFGIFHVVEAGP